ncbi:MAG: DUF4126 domain-containing protein [Chloroflexota bacterium]
MSMDVVTLVMPLALSAGINLYLTLFSLGLAIRLEWVEGLPVELATVGSIPVLAVTGVLTVVRFFAGKIPYVDTIWDLFHTVIRPGAAVALTTGLAGDLDPGTAAAISVVAGGTAFTSHSTKMGLHTIINSSPEPLTNTVADVSEDSIVLGLVILALRYPYIAAAITIVLLTVMVIVLPIMVRWSRFGIASLRSRLRSQRKKWDSLPVDYRAATGIKREPVATLKGTVRGKGRLSGRQGYLCVYDKGIVFVYGRWLRKPDTLKISMRRIRDAAHLRGILLDTLKINYVDGETRDKLKDRQVRFVFLKERADLSRELAVLLDADTSDGTLSSIAQAGGRLATGVHKSLTETGSAPSVSGPVSDNPA